MPDRPRRLSRVVFGAGRGIAGTVYGTILVMAAVTAGSASGHAPWRLTAVVVATVLVVWVAHVYAHALAESISRERRVDVDELVAIGGRELPIALAAVAPAGALLLGGLGVVRERTAVWIALGICLAALVVQGLRYARVEDLGRAATIAVVLANLALGSLVVAVKVVVAH